jgi:hypothetical protein
LPSCHLAILPFRWYPVARASRKLISCQSLFALHNRFARRAVGYLSITNVDVRWFLWCLMRELSFYGGLSFPSSSNAQAVLAAKPSASWSNGRNIRKSPKHECSQVHLPHSTWASTHTQVRCKCALRWSRHEKCIALFLAHFVLLLPLNHFFSSHHGPWFEYAYVRMCSTLLSCLVTVSRS